MSGETAYYCVIQYCPDRGREESANLGVLLYAPTSQRAQARVAVLSTRARSFFGLRAEQAAAPSAAAESLAHLVNSGAAQIDSPEALQAFVATRANDIRLTAPRLTKVTNFSDELNELFADLVQRPELAIASISKSSQPMIPSRLHAVFTKLSLQGRIKKPGKVRVPVLGRELDIPYAYQNGVLNLVKPQIFTGGTKAENRTMQLAVEGQLLEKHPENGERQLIVVAADGSTPEAEAHAAQLLKELSVRFVAQAEADAFAAEVEEQAH